MKKSILEFNEWTSEELDEIPVEDDMSLVFLRAITPVGHDDYTIFLAKAPGEYKVYMESSTAPEPLASLGSFDNLSDAVRRFDHIKNTWEE